jgi:D-serine deaminase-like pyridoxal phosphate-dependent protein
VSIYEYEIGLSKAELDTPALLLDLAVMERNLSTMADYFSQVKADLRPHVKVHKATPILAHKQIQAGAVGVTCAKLAEAEILAAAGIDDILIANQIVGARKVQRLVNLATYTDVMVAVDNAENVEELSRAATAKGVVIRALVEVNIGHDRCGVAPFEPVLTLSRAIAEAPGLEYMGLMGYDGHCTFRVEETEREECARKANQLLVETRRYVEDAGLKVKVVSGSGTFTYRVATALEGITEVQAGTYLLMDTAFKEHGVHEFDCALTVLATVTSRPSWAEANDLAVIDVGSKSMNSAFGMPEVKALAGATVLKLSQEHGRVRLQGEARNLKIGDKVELWVRNTNNTVNLYDKFYAIRDDIVEAVWEIPGRGKST